MYIFNLNFKPQIKDIYLRFSNSCNFSPMTEDSAITYTGMVVSGSLGTLPPCHLPPMVSYQTRVKRLPTLPRLPNKRYTFWDQIYIFNPNFDLQKIEEDWQYHQGHQERQKKQKYLNYLEWKNGRSADLS